MPSLGLNMRRLSRTQRSVDGGERTEMVPAYNTTAGPPPSYETVIGQDAQPFDRPGPESPASISRTASAPYRAIHQPPDYQASNELTRRQTITHVASTPSPAITHPQYGGGSLTQGLSRAALAGKLDTARALLEAGADLYESSPCGIVSPIHDALRGPEPQLALLLLDYPCERAYQGDLATLGGEARVRYLLSLQDKDGCTPLHLAASVGAADVVRELVELGAVVDAADKLGRTPLHMAARYGRADAMDVLLEHGAKPELVREELWNRACPKARSELGDCMFVMRGVTKAVMRRQGIKAEDLQDEGPSVPAQRVTMNGVANDKEPEAPETGSPLSRNGAPSRRSASSSNAVSAGFGASVEPRCVQSTAGTLNKINRGPAPNTAGFCTVLNRSAGRNTRRLPHVSMYSPEYDAWRKMCQAVQEEHRRQKERNASPGYDPYAGMY